MHRSVFVVRHAETAWNRELRYQGQTDIPLNEIGRDQARALRSRLAKRPALFDASETAVVSSDLSRAHETAQLAFDAPGRQIFLDPDLREMRYGIFEGLSRSEILERYPDEYHRWQDTHDYVIAGGEPRHEAAERAAKAVERWLSKLSHPNVVVMTHGGIMRQLLRLSLDGELPTQVSLTNVSCHVISIEQAQWVYAGSL